MKKYIIVLAAIVSFVALLSFSLKDHPVSDANDEFFQKDSIASVMAFKDVYKVLISPRCVNCHPSGDVPLQGDDSHLHSMLPQRGKDGKGINAMKCGNCHQATSMEGLNQPPGHPDWHLPPADMKMVFEGKTAVQLAKQLVNPKQTVVKR